jgi:hypothetical protein
MKTHLTLTGQFAGQILCGEPKTESTKCIHAVYVNRIDPAIVCELCAHIWECESASCFDSNHKDM